MLTTKEVADEAIRLMQLLGFSPEVISDYSVDGVVQMSVDGAAPIPLDAETLAQVREFEAERVAKVYHVVSGLLGGAGYCKNFLFVGKKFEDDLVAFETAAHRGRAYAHVINCTYPENTESGFVAIEHRPYPVRVS